MQALRISTYTSAEEEYWGYRGNLSVLLRSLTGSLLQPAALTSDGKGEWHVGFSPTRLEIIHVTCHSLPGNRNGK